MSDRPDLHVLQQPGPEVPAGPPIKMAANVKAFLDALPLADPEQFVNVPGFGTYRAKYVRRGLEREVVVVHSSGQGFAFLVPAGHVGMCQNCASRKGNICEHCGCAMCSWIRTAEERASPRVGREKLMQLARRLKNFEFGAPAPASPPALDDDI